ncbi:MAG: hypothetical protein A2521_00665 [Deltaproteobacteria bacterium RIFOXYD12_FULL_57_12]|nr:MAG: hypothetical protein A2521_00665 [Deltaproteobacteria bacterium RIFOXYD12_FULL_57_12]
MTPVGVVTALCLAVGFFLYHSWHNQSLRDYFTKKNETQLDISLDLNGLKKERGNIYDRNLRVIAGCYQTKAVFARPLELTNTAAAAKQLAKILQLNETDLLTTLGSERSFVWLGHNIAAAPANQIADLKLPGIYLIDEMNRIYPNQQIAAHVVGFVKNEQGLDGMEYQYDSILRGVSATSKDMPMLDFTEANEIAGNNAHVVLTLDLRSQAKLEQVLDDLVLGANGTTGTAILMDPNNGAVLALANRPTYNPNRFWAFTDQMRRNKAIADQIFPPEAPASQADGQSDETTIPGPDDQAVLSKIKGFFFISPCKLKKSLVQPEAPPPADIVPFDLAELLAGKPVWPVDLPIPKPVAEPATEPSAAAPPVIPTPLQTLATLARLVNGGNDIIPHVLNSVLDIQSQREFKTNYGQKKTAEPPTETSRDIWASLDKSWHSGPADSLYFVTASPANAFKETTDSPPAGHDSTAPAPAVSAVNRHHTLFLGVAPRQKPELVLLVVLNNSVLPPGADKIAQATAMFNKTTTLLPALLKFSQEPSTIVAADFWQKDRILRFENLLKEKVTTTDELATSAEPDQIGPMPALIGKSLRNGLQTLQRYEVQVKVKGAGMVVAQKPPAGAPLKKGDTCLLELDIKQ